MATEKELYPVSKEHAFWFGVFISEFARLELRLHVAAAGILGTDMGTATILLGDMTLRKKIQTVRHLNTTIGIKGKINKDIKDALAQAEKLLKLRNWIAHVTWKHGRRPKSIKPLRLILSGDEPKPLGSHHNEKDYTPKELQEEARKVTAASTKIHETLRKEGLLSRVQEEVDATRKSATHSPASTPRA